MSKSEKIISELSEKNKQQLRRLIRKSNDENHPECYYIDKGGLVPRMRVGGEIHAMVRVAYFMQTGEQSAGKFLRHSCGNKWCVRREHVFLSIHGEQRKQSRERLNYGRKLNFDMAEQIRTLNKAGWTDDTLAKSFMVSRTTINRVVNFELWPLRKRKPRGPNKPKVAKPVYTPDQVEDIVESKMWEIHDAHLKGEDVAKLAARFNMDELSILHAIGKCAFRRD